MQLHSPWAPQQIAHHPHALQYMKGEEKNLGDSCTGGAEEKTNKIMLLSLAYTLEKFLCFVSWLCECDTFK